MELNRLLTLREVADYCNVPEATLQRWINRKDLVVCYQPTGEARFRLIDVMAALEAHKKRISGIS